MKYLKKFNSVEEYSENKEAGLILPNVSVIISPTTTTKVFLNSKPKQIKPVQYYSLEGDTLVFTNYAKISSDTLILDKGSYSDNTLIL